MGLDISALENAVFASEKQNADYSLYRIHSDDFPDRFDGERSGYYEGDCEIAFRVGPYSYYNRFRDCLSETVLGLKAEAVWERAENMDGWPFVELINFTDCDGSIGPETSKKLAKDFEDHKDKFINAGRGSGYEETYKKFMVAFKKAAGNGFVIFH